MLRSIALAALLASSTLGCVAKPALTCPSKGGATWSRLRSTHFVLFTDRPTDEARAALDEYETIYDVFTNVVLSGDLGESVPIQVVLFNREMDYKSFAPRGADAYFQQRLPHDPEPIPTMVLWGDLVDARRMVFQHELAHHVFYRVLGPAPVWVHEGLAEYYSTMQIGDGAVTLGVPNPKFDFYLGRWASVDTGSFVRARIPIGAVPKASELISMDRETFYQRNHEGEPTMEESRARVANYAGAWAFVHMMNHTPGYAEAFSDFLGHLTAGKGYEEALSKGLGGLVETADRDLHEYLIKRERLMAKTSYTPKPHGAPSEGSALSDPEVHVLWNRLRPWGGEGEAGAALSGAVRGEFDEAIMRDPNLVEARLYRAVYFAMKGELDLAEADLGVALRRAPEDTNVLIAAVMVCVKGVKASGAESKFCKKNGDAVIGTLARVAKTPAAHDITARLLLDEGKVDEAFEHAKSAVKGDPGCASCLDGLAIAMHEKGMLIEAVRFEERAIAALSETQSGKTLMERLVQYRKDYAASRKRPAPAPPPESPPTGD